MVFRLLAALVWAMEVFAVQYITLVADTPMEPVRMLKRVSIRLLLNVLGCGALVCLLRGRWVYPAFAASSAMSFGLIAYYRSFLHPLSWTTIVSQFGEGTDSMAAGISAVGLPAVAALALALGLKIVLCESARGAGESSREFRLTGTATGAAYLGVVVMLIGWVRPMHGLAQWESVARVGLMYGYTLTWAGEAWYVNETELLKLALHRAEETESRRVELCEAPLAAPERLVVVQLESVAYAMLDAKVDDELVMPYLHELSGKSMSYCVRAVHESGSSDADFVFLMNKLPVGLVNPYALSDYPYETSMVQRLHAAGYASTAVHGNRGTFFARRRAYAKFGFKNVYFQRELEAAHLKPGPWGIADDDVFSFSSDLVGQSGRQFVFIITLTTHSPFTYLPAHYTSRSWGGDTIWHRYLGNMRYIDDSLKSFVESLPPETLVVLYGDHEPNLEPIKRLRMNYNEEYVPFLIYRTGDDLSTRQMTRESGVATSGDLSLLDVTHYVWQQVLAQHGAPPRSGPAVQVDCSEYLSDVNE